jgi:hypothetical protein
MSKHDEDRSLRTPKVIGAPAKIYLVYGDIEHDDTHQSLSEGEVSWCEDRQHDSDVEYVRADIAYGLKFAGWFREVPSGMSFRLWEQGGYQWTPGDVALYEWRCTSGAVRVALYE